MVIITEMNVLAVGMKDRTDGLDDLPIRMLNMAHGADAVRSFKTNQIDTVISHWHLADMPDGEFIRKLKTVKPDMPIVAVIESNDPQQEIEARMLGVSAVITEDCGGDYFGQVMTSVLGLPNQQLIEVFVRSNKEF
ncbi:MAG: hypothetical protein ACYSOF_06645 [Planctomycetota bacterium]|jgi:DNA-binding NarL/FixJ family response regulator